MLLQMSSRLCHRARKYKLDRIIIPNYFVPADNY